MYHDILVGPASFFHPMRWPPFYPLPSHLRTRQILIISHLLCFDEWISQDSHVWPMLDAPPGPKGYQWRNIVIEFTHPPSPSLRAYIQEVDLILSPNWDSAFARWTHLLLLLVFWLVLDIGSAIDLRLHMNSHPLHPFQFNIISIPSITRWSEGESIRLFVFFTKKLKRRFAARWIRDFPRRSWYCGFRWMNRGIMGWISDFSLSISREDRVLRIVAHLSGLKLTSTRSATAASVAAWEKRPKVAYSKIHDALSGLMEAWESVSLGSFCISIKLVFTVIWHDL